jgi:hypothetical protein
VTLKSCDDIEGTDVERFETEAEVIMAWKEMLKKLYLEEGYLGSADMRRYMEEQHRELNAMLSAMKLNSPPN